MLLDCKIFASCGNQQERSDEYVVLNAHSIHVFFKYLQFFPTYFLVSVVGFAPVTDKAVEKIFRFAKGFALDLPE